MAQSPREGGREGGRDPAAGLKPLLNGTPQLCSTPIPGKLWPLLTGFLDATSLGPVVPYTYSIAMRHTSPEMHKMLTDLIRTVVLGFLSTYHACRKSLPRIGLSHPCKAGSYTQAAGEDPEAPNEEQLGARQAHGDSDPTPRLRASATRTPLLAHARQAWIHGQTKQGHLTPSR